jgi:Holliday junction resolvase RusA-like endonuclease
MIDFFIPCIPPKSTHQAALRILRRHDGTQFVGKFATSKGKRVEGELLTLFAPFRPAAPMQGPLSLAVNWSYPWRKSEKKKNRERGEMPCDVRPDCDNLSKFVCDILTRLAFWNDDGQVCDLRFRKYWSEKPGIGITIDPVKTITEKK